MTGLSAFAHTKGLSKKKILVIFGICGLILIGMLMFGVFKSDKGNKVIPDEGVMTYQDKQQENDQLLQQVVNKRLTASVPAASILVPPSAKPDAMQMVPPISVVKKERTLQEQAQAEYDSKQLAREYTSYAAKSLLYSSIPASAKDSALSSSPVRGSLLQPSPKNGQPGLAIAGGAESVATISVDNIEKKQFMQNSKTLNTDYLQSDVTDARSPYEVKAGSVIPATMINGLNSDLPGQIIAQVRENVYDSSTRRYLLIPQGARLVGLYDNNISYGQERVLVAWNRLIYPDGSSINLRAMPGTDLSGYAGFHDQVDNKYWKIFGTSFIMGAITGAMQYSQNNTNANVQVGGNGVTTNTDPTVGQTLSGSLGQQLGQTGLSVAQKNLNVQPTLIVQPNYPFNIMITADMVLRPLTRQ